MIISKGISSSVIRRYTQNINKINIRLSRLVVLLRTLNTIYKTIFLLILGNSTIII
jgi:hypothetical protein